MVEEVIDVGVDSDASVDQPTSHICNPLETYSLGQLFGNAFFFLTLPLYALLNNFLKLLKDIATQLLVRHGVIVMKCMTYDYLSNYKIRSSPTHNLILTEKWIVGSYLLQLLRACSLYCF